MKQKKKEKKSESRGKDVLFLLMAVHNSDSYSNHKADTAALIVYSGKDVYLLHKNMPLRQETHKKEYDIDV